jgi:MFS family permease
VTTAAPQVSIALIAMAGFASGAGMRIMDPLLPLIGQDFGVPTASVSILIAAFMITYGGGQIGTGPAGDRFGKLRVAAIALVLFGIFTIGAEFSGSLTQLALLRAAGGLVSGAVIPLLMAHIGDSVPYHERQAVLGQFLIGNVMSQMLASPISGILGEHLGWRASFLVFGCFTAAIGLPEREVQVERQPHEAQQMYVKAMFAASPPTPRLMRRCTPTSPMLRLATLVQVVTTPAGLTRRTKSGPESIVAV